MHIHMYIPMVSNASRSFVVVFMSCEYRTSFFIDRLRCLITAVYTVYMCIHSVYNCIVYTRTVNVECNNQVISTLQQVYTHYKMYIAPATASGTGILGNIARSNSYSIILPSMPVVIRVLLYRDSCRETIAPSWEGISM